MFLVIDASNIKAGGGLTHLYEILESDQAVKVGFKRIYLWAPDKTLEKISNKKWIEKCSHPLLNGNYLKKIKWKKTVLEPFVKNKNSLLFIPGTGNSSLPFVTMCQNLLPIDERELNRYFPSKDWFRLRLLRMLHLKSYKEAEGVIFLNSYCKDILPSNVSKRIKKYAIIAHGLNKRFLTKEKQKMKIEFSSFDPFKILYVSVIDVYKHQWQVAEAVYQLIEEGYKINLDLIGPSYKPALAKLEKVMDKYKHVAGVNYLGSKSYGQVHNQYKEADAFIFASTCETYGMVITEAMAAGLPIICSNYSSMPETVGDACIYFDPMSIDSIKDSILKLYREQDLRYVLSERSLEKAKGLSWNMCAGKTFEFLAEISQKTCVE